MSGESLRNIRFDTQPRISTLKIFLVVVVAITALLAIVTPANRGPDEPMHTDLVLKAAELTISNPMTETLSPAVVSSLNKSKGVLSTSLEAEEAQPRKERLSYLALGGVQDDTTQANGISQHPPLYYFYSAAVREVVLLTMPDPIPWDQDLLLIRLTNIPLLVATILLCVGAIRRSNTRSEVSLLLILFLPQFLWLHAIVNNDNMLIATAAGFVYLLSDFSRRHSRRWVAFLGLSVGLALLSKAFAIALVAVGSVVVFSYARGLRRRIENLLIFNVVAFVVGGWWYAWRYLEYGTFIPKQSLLKNKNPVEDLDLLYFIRRFVLQMTQSFVGKFGWLDVRTSWPYSAAVLLITMALLAIGLRLVLKSHRLRRDDRQLFPVLFMLWLVQVAIAFDFALGAHINTGLFPAIQGRYLLPTVSALIVMLSIVLGQKYSPQWRLLYLALPIPWIISLEAMFDAWYEPERDSISISGVFRNLAAWSPVEPAWVLSLLLVSGISMGMLMKRGITTGWDDD